MGVNEEVLDVHGLGEFSGRDVLLLRIDGRPRRYGKDLFSTQGLVGHLEEKRAVDSSGKGNEQGAHLPDDSP